jgi:hypothetical protein
VKKQQIAPIITADAVGRFEECIERLPFALEECIAKTASNWQIRNM